MSSRSGVPSFRKPRMEIVTPCLRNLLARRRATIGAGMVGIVLQKNVTDRVVILEREIASRGEEVAGTLSDEQMQAIVTTYAKQRRDSITSYREGGRDDLVQQEEAELAIVTEYLPRQLSEEEIRKIVAEAIEESGASSPRDLGAVMKLAMPRVKGAADGKRVNQIARELVAGE